MFTDVDDLELVPILQMLAADCFEIGDRLDGVGRAAGDVERA